MKKSYLRLVRRAFRSLRHPRLRHRPWWQAISRPLLNRNLWIPCRDTVASGLAIGLFFSMMPMIPQSIVAAILAMRVKANVPFAMAACFISNPFTNVPFWIAQIRLGQWLIDVLSLPVPHFLAKAHMSLPGVGTLSVSNYIVGFVAMGLLLALAAYPLVHLFSVILPHHLPVRKRPVVPAAAATEASEI
jgi:uncharacterized protein (DUF2062 family)